jgi:ABC-2 type transport system permease protein
VEQSVPEIDCAGGLTRVNRFLGILTIYFKASMKSKFEYRGAFIWDAVGFILGYGTKFTLMWILITKFKYLNGWSPFEVMFLFSLSISSYTLASIFLGASTSQLPKKILNGSFDQSLTKPVNPFLFEVASAFSSYYFTHFIVSFTFLLICIVNLGIQFNVLKVLFLIVFIFGSALIQGGMMILLNSVSFWI